MSVKDDNKRLMFEDTVTTVMSYITSFSGIMFRCAINGCISRESSRNMVHMLRRAADVLEKRSEEFRPSGE